MNLDKYCGIIPAFYACYDDSNEVSAERTRAFARYLVNKGVLKINEGLELGSVRKPLTGLQEGDWPKVEAAAKHIKETIAKYC